MSRFPVSVALLITLGCRQNDQMNSNPSSTEAGVQLFNEAVLGSSPTDAVSVLQPSANTSWSPRQVVLDYKDDACYGAMVHYDRSRSFENLRSAINTRFGEHEQPAFANDPTMGIWRMDDREFSIQLSDNDEEDSYTAIYVQFVDLATMADKIEELSETDPELFEDFPLDEFSDAMREIDATDSTGPDAR